MTAVMAPAARCTDCGEPMTPKNKRRLGVGRQHEGHGRCRPCYMREYDRHRERVRSGYRQGPHGSREDTRARDAEIARLTRAGRSARSIALELRTTERTVQRARRRHARVAT